MLRENLNSRKRKGSENVILLVDLFRSFMKHQSLISHREDLYDYEKNTSMSESRCAVMRNLIYTRKYFGLTAITVCSLYRPHRLA